MFFHPKICTMSSSSASLTQLAKGILANAQIIEGFLSSNNLPQPSFGANGPKDFPVGAGYTEIHAARHALIDATKELRDLVIYPTDTLKWMIMNVSNVGYSKDFELFYSTDDDRSLTVCGQLNWP